MHCFLRRHASQELAASDMTAMAVMQPDNIKLLARKASPYASSLACLYRGVSTAGNFGGDSILRK